MCGKADHMTLTSVYPFAGDEKGHRSWRLARQKCESKHFTGDIDWLHEKDKKLDDQ